MNFAKTFTGVVTGAVASVAAGFFTAAVGMATLTLLPAAVTGAVVGLILSIVNSGQPQGMMGNAFIGGLATMLAYFFTAAALATGAGAITAIVSGFVVGVVYTMIVDSVES